MPRAKIHQHKHLRIYRWTGASHFFIHHFTFGWCYKNSVRTSLLQWEEEQCHVLAQRIELFCEVISFWSGREMATRLASKWCKEGIVNHPCKYYNCVLIRQWENRLRSCCSSFMCIRNSNLEFFPCIFCTKRFFCIDGNILRHSGNVIYLIS